MNIAEALNLLCPLARYRGYVGDSTQAQYEAIDWDSGTPKPEWSVVEAKMKEAPPSKVVSVSDSLTKLELRIKALEDDRKLS